MSGRAEALVVPLKDAAPALLGDPMHRSGIVGSGSGSAPAAATTHQLTRLSGGGETPLAASSPAHPRPTSSKMGEPYVSEASLDFQRSLLQQQVQQGHREMERLKAELHEVNVRLSETRQLLNEQKAAHTSLTHRYGATVEKLTAAEGDVKGLEQQLVQERQQRQQLQTEREEQRLALREAEWAHERLQRRLTQLEASKGLDPAEVQRRLEDRTQFIPAVELYRMQTEMHTTHQALADRLLTSLESLTASGAESQTNIFVARSAVLSAATDMDARLQRAEAALDDVDRQWTAFRGGVEAETHAFLLAVMAENKDLWQQLTLLQSEHALVVAEVKLRSVQGGSVAGEEHAYVQRQLQAMTERLSTAQQLVQSQTVLARAHEQEMAELLEANDTMQRRLEELERRCAQLEQTSDQRARALAEADATLGEATAQIAGLQGTLRDERQRCAAVVAEVKATQRTMQDEYDSRVRQLEHDCEIADDATTTLQHTLEETAAKLDVVERALQSRSHEYASYKAHVTAEHAEAVGRHRDDLQRVRAVMEEEVTALRAQLEEAREAARAAARDGEEAAVRESTTALAHRAAQQELSRLQDELARLRGQLTEAVEHRQRALAEAEQLRAASGEGSTLAQELQRRCDAVEKERAELAATLAEETARLEKRHAALHADWRASEKARASIQEEAKTLRARCAELEGTRMAEERQTQDREQLMRENIRLHELHQGVQRECTALREEVKALKQRGAGDAQWHKQMDDLQRRLRELPELRQAADAARRDALTAKEETELLRRERDQLSKKLDTFLESARQQAQREGEFERVCREASAAAQRIGGQVSSAKETASRYHVFRNTHPTGRVPAAAAEGAPRAVTTASPGSAAASPQRRSPVHAAANGTGHAQAGDAATNASVDADAALRDPPPSSSSSPSRPWR
ncbi:hypothetical protein NESM_000890500 [Novymonas esmeraldas]|uniref:Uncharacterized protein n=1 Tax=Novymonas esmeraldas TaxID=1808958 RepID=A0AAW0F296_9TRYP